MPEHLGKSRIAERVERVYSNPVLAVLMEPTRDLLNSTAGTKVIILLSGSIAWLYSSAFESALMLAVFVSWWDWRLGKYAARAAGTYNADTARVGMHVKITTFVQLVVLRLGEGWAALHVTDQIQWMPDSRGWIATGLLVGFIASELDSIDRHKVTLGGRPLWGWSKLSGFIRGRVDAMIPGGMDEEDVRRQSEIRRGNPPAPKRGNLRNGTDN
jgi:hypothetical protein